MKETKEPKKTNEKEEQALKEMLLVRTRKLLDTSVKEVLIKNVLSCDFNDLVAKGARIMLENNFLGIIIIKEGRPVNIVTAFDLLRLAYNEVFDPTRGFLLTKLGELVEEKEFISIGPDTKLREVLNIMVTKRVRTLPVIQENEVLGVCTIIDLMHWYRKTHEEIRTGKL